MYKTELVVYRYVSLCHIYAAVALLYLCSISFSLYTLLHYEHALLYTVLLLPLLLRITLLSMAHSYRLAVLLSNSTFLYCVYRIHMYQ
jgi:hypothetical protein